MATRHRSNRAQALCQGVKGHTDATNRPRPFGFESCKSHYVSAHQGKNPLIPDAPPRGKPVVLPPLLIFYNALRKTFNTHAHCLRIIRRCSPQPKETSMGTSP